MEWVLCFDAIGTTHAVQGSFRIRTGQGPVITAMKITVDLRTLQTDSPMRDRYVQRNPLETELYPYATFVSVEAKGLPASYEDGQNVHFQLLDNLTLHGKTNQETFDVQGVVNGDPITGKATGTIYMTDFGIQPPNLANIAIAENRVDITITFTARSQQPVIAEAGSANSKRPCGSPCDGLATSQNYRRVGQTVERSWQSRASGLCSSLRRRPPRSAVLAAGSQPGRRRLRRSGAVSCRPG
jgi:polyisoprenoid-binding protein YceI